MQLQSIKPSFLFFPYRKILLLFLGLNTLVLLSCSNKIGVSKYAKYNRIDLNWLQTYINDSLSFSIDFWGRNNYTAFANKTKYFIPKSDIAVLKSLNIRKRAKLLLYLKPGIKRYGQASYGYLVDKKFLDVDTNYAKFDKAKKGDDFFTLKQIFKKGDETTVVGGTEIKDKYFLLIESQKEEAIPWWDNEGQKGNTILQLSTLLKGDNTVSYLARRKKFINAIDSSLYIKNYVKAVAALRAIPEDTIEHYNLDNFYHQDILTRVSYFDDLDSIHKSYEQYRSPSTTVNPNNKFIIDGDAIAKVYQIAQSQRMLMINENHDDFRHRLFVGLLLDSLYKIGYKNFCVEALQREVKNSYVNKEDGFYMSEPFMAGVIRKAKEIGFNVYGYDTSAATIPEREYGQATNLFNLYKKDPEHKWIVLAGYAHINKRYFSGDSKSALQYFTQLAGFAPFSINQSELSDITDQRYTVPDTPTGYYAVDTSSFIYQKKQTDLYIINNIKTHPFEAPFAAIKPYLQKYIIDIQRRVNPDENIMVYAKKELDELHDLAIPVYITNSEKDKPFILHLPPNEYVGVIINNDGNEVMKFQVVIENTMDKESTVSE